MKYIVCEKPGLFKMKEKSAPTLTPNQALLKITKIGICGTDLHAYQGNQAFFTYPRILGHELSAEILEIGANDQQLSVGDRVVIMPYMSCGHCIACRYGKTNCCTNIKVLGVHADGGMQEVILVPSRFLLKANHLDDEQIAIVEPLAIGAHAVRRANITKVEFVLVVGCGPIGIGIIRLAQLNGARVIAMDVNEDRLDFVKGKWGIHTVNALNDPAGQINQITNGDGCTAVFDASGNKRALESGVQYMSHGGRYILVGLYNGDLTFAHPFIHSKETTLMCSRNATLEDFQTVMQVLENGQFPLETFITHRVDFDDMITNFDSWLQPETGVIKAMVSF